MNRLRSISLPLLAAMVWLGAELSSPACSACFGRSNDKMITAYYVGAILLVGLITLVLGGVTAFFVVIARRSAALERAGTSPQDNSQTNLES